MTVKAESRVSDQPLTSNETRRGSMNRARGALKEANKADIGMGIEVGYQKVRGRYQIFCWTSIIDRAGLVISHQSTRFPLPDFHNKKVTSGKQLGLHVREYFALSRDPITKYLGELLRNRRPFIYDATIHGMLRYLKKHEYS